MFAINEISAAPHFPHALRPLIVATAKPEAVVSLLVRATECGIDVEVTEHDGEICVAINASLIEG
jgi:hypothetical protein